MSLSNQNEQHKWDLLQHMSDAELLLSLFSEKQDLTNKTHLPPQISQP